MKTKIPSILAAALILASFAVAGTYSVTTTENQDTRLERQRVRLNRATCQAANLPNDCTQAQARAVTPGVNIYSDIADLIDREIIKNYLQGLANKDKDDDNAQAAAYWAGATNAQKNAICAAAGLPNGCEIWPR